jgi:hypothetical protein
MSNGNGIGIGGVIIAFVAIPILAIEFSAYINDPGSMKDRIGEQMLQFYNRNGHLPSQKKGDEIIEDVVSDFDRHAKYKQISEHSYKLISDGADNEYGTYDDVVIAEHELVPKDN